MKTISDHILDILQNSTRAGATVVSLDIEIRDEADRLEINISDNGPGIDISIAGAVTDPFTTTRSSRRVGLGLPLLKQHVELTGGSLDITPTVGGGTEVKALFVTSSIDRQPIGDLAGTVALFITGNPNVNMIFSLQSCQGRFTISSDEISGALDDDLANPAYYRPLREMMTENITPLLVGCD